MLYFVWFIGIKLKAPKILVDPIPENIDLENLKKKWLESRKSFKLLIRSLDKNILNNASNIITFNSEMKKRIKRGRKKSC